MILFELNHYNPKLIKLYASFHSARTSYGKDQQCVPATAFKTGSQRVCSENQPNDFGFQGKDLVKGEKQKTIDWDQFPDAFFPKEEQLNHGSIVYIDPLPPSKSPSNLPKTIADQRLSFQSL